MRISYNWLKSYIDIDLTPHEAAERLTNSGLEVEGIEPIEVFPGGLDGLVIGKVVEKWSHPNADRLSVTRVDIGEEELLNIVCGAPNVDKDQKVVVATIGTTLYPSNGEPFKIKKGKIRGEHSYGMICAEDEIGMGTGHDGIMVLDNDAKMGQPAADYFNIEKDFAIEIGLTPNRTDGMSHIGVARDLAAVLSLENKKQKAVNWPDVSAFKVDHTETKISVSVESKEACPRYSGLRLSEVEVKESPDWLKERLKTIGLTPINNVVDITNFVLHETGQPLHAFDADKIAGNRVVVQTLPLNTSFVTLDETKRALSDKDLMICDGKEGMCIAGVFGGIHSGVTDQTSELFLESAYFNPVWVRKTAKRHGLNTDSSFRFERGVDPDLTVYALKRAALLLKEFAGAKISSEIIDLYPEPMVPNQVLFSKDRSDRLIGKTMDEETVRFVLSLLDIRILSEKDHEWLLEIPTYRVDVTREADVVEEILRIYGFNNVEIPEKLRSSLSYSSDIEPENMVRKATSMLTARGFSEMMANSLTADKYTKQLNSASFLEEHLVKVVNPLSTDLNVLRQTLLYSGLEAIAYNQNRQSPNLKLFEFGNVYARHDKFEENFRLAIYLSGKTTVNTWNNPEKPFTFFDLKGEVEALLLQFGLLSKVSPANTDLDYFEQGLSYQLGRETLVSFGVVKSKITQAFDVRETVFFADIDWDLWLRVLKKGITYTALPKFPAVRRDLSLLIDEHITFEAIRTVAFKTERKLLKSVDLFDVYQGKNLATGKKSYAVSFILQDVTKTLNDKVIDKIMLRIQNELESQLGASLRG